MTVLGVNDSLDKKQAVPTTVDFLSIPKDSHTLRTLNDAVCDSTPSNLQNALPLTFNVKDLLDGSFTQDPLLHDRR
jgi:hypothetical protein